MDVTPVVLDEPKRKTSKVKMAIERASSMFRRREVKHQMILEPMVSEIHEMGIYVCGKKVLHVDSYHMGQDVLDAVKTAGSVDKAARIFVPSQEKYSRQIHKHTDTFSYFLTCASCGWIPLCGERRFHKYDFIFNRYRFTPILIMGLSLVFLSLILLRYNLYLLNFPTCQAIYVDRIPGEEAAVSVEKYLYKDNYKNYELSS